MDFRFMLAGRAREMALGPVTDVSLVEARVKAAEARKLTREGRDPIVVKDEAQAALRAEELETSDLPAGLSSSSLRRSASHSSRTTNTGANGDSTLQTYAYPGLW